MKRLLRTPSKDHDSDVGSGSGSGRCIGGSTPKVAVHGVLMEYVVCGDSGVDAVKTETAFVAGRVT